MVRAPVLSNGHQARLGYCVRCCHSTISLLALPQLLLKHTQQDGNEAWRRLLQLVIRALISRHPILTHLILP